MPQNQALISSPIVPALLLFLVFYFLIIRPQNKKEKERQNMLTKIAKNDEVITSGGIHGTVVNVKERTLILRIDDNVKIELEKDAVTTVKRSANPGA